MRSQSFPEVGFVVFDASASRLKKLRHWAKSIGAAQSIIVENKSGKAQNNVLQGTNQYSEFSAYMQLCRHFEGNGPFIIVNDTLVRTHWPWGWAMLCQKILKHVLPENAVVGDIRNDHDHIPGKPSTYLASWIFILPTRRTLEAFAIVLEQAVQNHKQPTPEYNRWLESWLKPSSWFSGWHRMAEPEALARKRFCIITEHRLSTLLPENQLQMVSAGRFAPLLYRLVRIIDRFKTRIKATWMRLSLRFKSRY